MQIRHRLVLGATGLAAAAPAAAAGLDVTVTLPRIPVAEYHRPYVAMWIEGPGLPQARTLAVWYDTKLKNNEGTKWLRDLRGWWRKGGRALALPADGISGPTRAPGPQKARFDARAPALRGLAPGRYELVVEAAREAGGRELVRVPFSWGQPGTARAAGTTELGDIAVAVTR